MSELVRKLYRTVGLIFPLIYLFMSRNFTIIILLALSSLLIIIEIMRFLFPGITKTYFKYLSAIAKKKEQNSILGTTSVVVSSLLIVLLFDKNIAVVSLFFLVIGDTAAVLVGKNFGRIRIGKKTLEGTLGCFLVCLLIGTILIYSNVIQLGYISILLGSLGASLGELLPGVIFTKKINIDDNFSTGLLSGFFMYLTNMLM